MSLGIPDDAVDVPCSVTPRGPDMSIVPSNFSSFVPNVLSRVSPDEGIPDVSRAPSNDQSHTSDGPSNLPPLVERRALLHVPRSQNLDDGHSSPDGLGSPVVLSGIDGDDTNDYDTEDSDGTAAIGRISDVNVAIMKAGYLEVQKAAKDVAARTGLSVSQVFKQWSLTHRRKHVGLNHWNLYSKYFKDNEKQELARLPYCES